MPLRSFLLTTRATLLVLLQLCVVHCAFTTPALHAQEKTQNPSVKTVTTGKPRNGAIKVFYGSIGLPAQVQQMREHIMAAVRSGRIEDLRIAIEWNELRPRFADSPLNDPIDHFKARSGDGEGREILAILGEILDAGYVKQPLGSDIENNLIFTWPYFGALPLAGLTPAQEVEVLRLISPAALKRMKAEGRYTGWRLSIGADGTWHEFIDGR